jgi:hypothetical protein
LVLEGISHTLEPIFDGEAGNPLQEQLIKKVADPPERWVI